MFLSWLSAHLVEKQLGIKGVNHHMYGELVVQLGSEGTLNKFDRMVGAVSIQSRVRPQSIEVVDRHLFLSTLLRWEQTKDINWMTCCRLVNVLLGEATARNQYPEYDKIMW
jgi:hypothetical protein